MALTKEQTQAAQSFAQIFGAQQVGQVTLDSSGHAVIILRVARDKASVINFIDNKLVGIRGSLNLNMNNISFRDVNADSAGRTDGDLALIVNDPAQLQALATAFQTKQAELKAEVTRMQQPAVHVTEVPRTIPSGKPDAAPRAAAPAPRAAAPAASAPAASGDLSTTTYIAQHNHRATVWSHMVWGEIQADPNAKLIGNGPGQFANEGAFTQWFMTHNTFVDHNGRLCDRTTQTGVTRYIDKNMDIVLPSGFTFTDKSLCDPRDNAPGRVRARHMAQPAPEPVAMMAAPPPPPAPEAGPRDPFFALPQNVSPVQRQQLRIQDYLLGAPSVPADFPARRQVDRATARGNWEGRDPAHFDGQYGGMGATIGSFFPPFGMLAGALVGTGADMVSLRAKPNLQSDLPARQPNADSRVNNLEGWRLDERGIPVRINPNDNLNQPDASHNNGGLISGYYADAIHNQNWDIATQAVITERLGAPNVQVGLRTIEYLRPKIGEAYVAFHTNPTAENGQRVLNLVAAAGATDVAQMSGTVDAMSHFQDNVVAEAAAHNPPIQLHTYDLHNPASIPGLKELNVHLTALPGSVKANDPGFMDNFPGMSREQAIADYDRRFAGQNLDSFYSYARTGQNSVTRDLGRGGVITPSTAEVTGIAADGINIINRSPESRAAFRAQVANDTGSDHPNQFGLIINKSLNDMVQQPQSWGFRNRDEAVAYATSLVGEDLVNRQYRQRTATPEPGSAGRTRDEAATSAAFARFASDDGINDWLNRIKNHPQDAAAPENRPGVYAQSVLHQLSLQGAGEPGFNAIANANPPLNEADRARFHTDVTRVSSYETWVSRSGGRPLENTARPEDVNLADTYSLAAAGERRYTAVGPDGKPLPNQPIRDGIATVDNGVIGIQAARARGDVAGANVLAVQNIMANHGATASSLEALGAFDRSTALNVVLESMARDPKAFKTVVDQVRHSQRTSTFFGLFHSDGERGRFADRLEDAADKYRDLMDRQREGRKFHGHLVTDADFAEARSRVEGFVALIDDAQAGHVHLIQDLDDDGRPVGRPRPPRSDDDYDKAAEGALASRRNGTTPSGPVTFVGDNGEVRTLDGRAAEAARRVATPNVRADQQGRAVAGQDTMITLLQTIGADPAANRVTARTTQDMVTGAVISHNAGVTGSTVAAGVVAANIAAMPQQTGSGLEARSVALNRDGASSIVAANTGDNARVQAAAQAALAGMSSDQIQAGLQPGARGVDAARIQAFIHSAAPNADAAQVQAAMLAAIQAQTGNVNSGSTIDAAHVPTKPGVLTHDIAYIIIGAIIPFIHSPHHPPKDEQTPGGGVPGGGTGPQPRPPGGPGDVVSPKPPTPIVPSLPSPPVAPAPVPTGGLPTVGGGTVPVGRPVVGPG